MNYDHKLKKLERKYFYEREKGFFETGKFVNNSLHELYGFCQGLGYQIKCVVGMKEATTMFYKMVPEFPVALTPYEKEEFVDWDAFDIHDAILIIGSFNSSRRIERRFWNMNLKCMILNLYDYFYYRGYELHTDFWVYSSCKGEIQQAGRRRITAFLGHYYFRYGICHKILNYFSISDQWAYNPIWSRTFCMRKAYESGQGNIEMRSMYLQRFIAENIKGRDYLTAKKYILEYIENCYDGAERYQRYLIQWEKMLEEIRVKIANREQEDLIINWLDAVSRSRMKDAPYLCRLAESNVQLRNAYTAMPGTSWCMRSIFAGIGVMEGKLYHYKKIKGKKFKLMRMIKEHGFRFYYIGPRLFQRKVFLNRDSTSREMKEHEISYTYYYWKMLCILATSRKKLFLIVHEHYGTHPPFFSPELFEYEEGTGEFAKEEQKQISCRYMDRQLEWWDSFLNKKICRIYMGDHGDPDRKPNFAYLSDRSNVIFIIKNGKKTLKGTDRFFSLKDMGKLIEYIMQWDDCNEDGIYSDYVCIEDFDWYSRERVDALLSIEYKKYAEYRNWMQLRALRTESDMLVKYANGQEWYFLLPDEEVNHADDLEYQDRIQELRERLGEGFVNIWEEDFFLHSRRLYQTQKNTG